MMWVLVTHYAIQCTFKEALYLSDSKKIACHLFAEESYACLIVPLCKVLQGGRGEAGGDGAH